mgnify:CR=1 FL=1
MFIIYSSVSNNWELTIKVFFDEVVEGSSGSIAISIPGLGISAQKDVTLDPVSGIAELPFTVPVSFARVSKYYIYSD